MLSIATLAIFGARTIYATDQLKINGLEPLSFDLGQLKDIKIKYFEKDESSLQLIIKNEALSLTPENFDHMNKKCSVFQTSPRDQYGFSRGIIFCDQNDFKLFGKQKDHFGYWFSVDDYLEIRFHENLAKQPVWIEKEGIAYGLSMTFPGGYIIKDRIRLIYSNGNSTLFTNGTSYYYQDPNNYVVDKKFSPTSLGPTFVQYFRKLKFKNYKTIWQHRFPLRRTFKYVQYKEQKL